MHTSDTQTPQKSRRFSGFIGTSLLGTSLLGASLLLATPTQATASPGANQKSSHNFHMQVSSGGQLGAQVTSMSDDLRSFFGAPAGVGLLVDRVTPDSPAAKAGLQSGDVITQVQGNAIAGPMDIFEALARQKTGDTVTVEVVRNHKTRSLQATLDGTSPLRMQWGSAQAGSSPFGMDHAFSEGFPFAKEFPFALGDLFGKGKGKIELGKGFPFEQDGDAMQEKIRRLEERLNRLEDNKAPKSGTRKHFDAKPSEAGPKS